KITGFVNNTDPGPEYNGFSLNYTCYDVYRPAHAKQVFAERYEFLKSIFGGVHKSVVLLPTRRFDKFSYVEIADIYDNALAKKYEGIMLRRNTPYALGARTSDLLKFKPEYDAEFEVIGWSMANHGKAAGMVMIRCQN